MLRAAKPSPKSAKKAIKRPLTTTARKNKPAKRVLATKKRNVSTAAEGEYDVVIIGGGPAGYVGAIKAAQLGLKVTCVEGRGSLGGTCLNVGCIPSKALLNATHHFHNAKHSFSQFGIQGGENVTMDHDKMMNTKDKIVTGLTKGIEHLFKSNKVVYTKGWGKIQDPNTVSVSLADGSTQQLKTKNIIIATGSEPSVIPGVQVDEERIVTSTGALSLKSVPKRFAVIGAGVIGLELGSVYSRIGSQVTVIGNGKMIAQGTDSQIATMFQKSLEKQGMKFKLGANVQKIVRKGEVVEVSVNRDGVDEVVEADVVLLSVGRKAYVKGLGLEEVGVKFDRSIPINEKFQTNIPNIYAVGDVAGNKPMLAHVAEEEIKCAVENIAGLHGHMDYNAVPGVIYTHPEVATVGKSEDDLKAAGIPYKVGSFPFMANSRAASVLDKEGMVKIMACAKTDKILGCHMMGPSAGELIQEVVLAMSFGASSEDLSRTIHGHPNLGEAVLEAATAAAFGKAIHI